MTGREGSDPSPSTLLARARETLADCYSPERHRAACALSTEAGVVHTGIHLDATIGTASVHAEAAAIANACQPEHEPIDCIVAVSFVPDESSSAEEIARDAVLDAPIIPPCGTCRELIYEYGPDASVVVSATPTVDTRPIEELLPDAPWFTGWTTQ